VAGTTVTLTWSTLSPEIDAWIVESGSQSGLSDLGVLELAPSATAFVARDVPPGTYFVRVRGRSAGTAGPPSNEVVVTVNAGTCVSGPIALTATVAGATVALQWSGVPGGASSVVEAGTASGRVDAAVVEMGAATSLTTAAAPGVYFVRVRARSACGWSAPSNEVTVRVGGGEAPGPCLTTDTSLTRAGTRHAGTIADADCPSPQRPGFKADLYRFSGTAGSLAIISMNTGLMNNNPFLALTGPDGRVIAQSSGFLGMAILNAVSLPATGEYVIEAGGARADGRFAYTLDIRCVAGSTGCN
jgi:hypothetical protein